MDYLSRTEEMILLAVYGLGKNAYGVTIRDFLGEKAGRRPSIGAVYVPLDRLVKRGLLGAYSGGPTPERGGRSKRFYEITSAGRAELKKVRALQESMWAGIGTLEPELGVA